MSYPALERMRELIQTDPGRRGLATDPTANLFTECAGDFAAACQSIAEHPSPALAIVTGFFIPDAEPPAGETDGPLEALFLARALVPVGIRVGIVSDGFCTQALQRGLEACGLAQRVPLLPLPEPTELWEPGGDFLRGSPLSHLVALERVGPARSDNRCHTMRGRDISEMMSPAHHLFEACAKTDVTTIGIGDGGNEIGMGKIPWDIIERNIPRGAMIACRVPTDYLIVCGVSNWGAYALAAGVLALRGHKPPVELFDVECERTLLQLMVENGPLVDGVLGRQAVSVDGLPFDEYAKVLACLGTMVNT